MRIREEGKLVALGARQQGGVTLSQLSALGVTRAQIRSRVGSGRWRLVLPRVLRIAAPSSDWYGCAWAVALWAGPDALLSHRSAAALYRLREPVSGEPIDVSAARQLRAPSSWVRAHQIRGLVPKARRSKDGLPLTSPLRTLLDLATISEEDALEAALRSTIRRRLVALRLLKSVIGELSPHGLAAARLRRLLGHAHASVDIQSELEAKALALFRRAKLPLPRLQYAVVEQGRLLGTVDFAWPERRLIVEAEGYEFHSSREAWARDVQRYNGLALHGWRVLRVTWKQLERAPATLLTPLAVALRAPPSGVRAI